MSTTDLATLRAMEARKHHPYSPSGLQAREACAGFLGEHVSNPAAERGTFLHDAIETYLRTGELHPDLDDNEALVVVSCAEFARERELEMGPETERIMEEYLPIDKKDTTAGYLDIGLINQKTKRGKLIDWKTGLQPIEETNNNLQGAAYLLGLEFRFPGVMEECEVIFVMPFQGESGLIQSFTFQRAGFDRQRLRIETVIARAKDAAADFESGEILKTYRTKLKPSNGTCLFCARKAGCPALHDLVLTAGRKYDPLIVPDVINPMLIRDAAQAGAALKFFQVMEALAKAYRAKATEKALNEEAWVPKGYYVTTMTVRKIIDNQKFAETIRPFLTKEEFLQCITFTLGPVETAIRAKTPLGKKAEAVEELSRLLAMNGATRESEPVIQLRQRNSPEKVESVSLLK